jgi:hypothetical protein
MSETVAPDGSRRRSVGEAQRREHHPIGAYNADERTRTISGPGPGEPPSEDARASPAGRRARL